MKDSKTQHEWFENSGVYPIGTAQLYEDYKSYMCANKEESLFNIIEACSWIVVCIVCIIVFIWLWATQ